MATQKGTAYVFLGPAFYATFATNATYVYCAVVQRYPMQHCIVMSVVLLT